jgi:hypothetical protein
VEVEGAWTWRGIRSEGVGDPENRRARFYSSAGSANETLAALRVAVAWGYFAEQEAEVAAGVLPRVIGMLWKLTRG